VASLTRLPGIGKKTAERIIVELRDKLEGMALPAGGASAAQAAAPAGAAAEARAALVSLGYKPTEVNRMIGAVAEEGMEAEEIIRKALQSRVKST
jgi:Holliday junction DNA helicase RuvA